MTWLMFGPPAYCKILRSSFGIIGEMYMVVEPQTAVTMEAFQSLSRHAKLLICYALTGDLEQIPIMTRDRDADELVDHGWLVEKTSRTIGVKNFSFPDKVLDDLLALREQILSQFTEEDLERYKQSKRAYYPWLW